MIPEQAYESYARRLESIERELADVRQLLNSKSVNVYVQRKCQSCGGTGLDPQRGSFIRKQCNSCNGKGF